MPKPLVVGFAILFVFLSFLMVLGGAGIAALGGYLLWILIAAENAVDDAGKAWAIGIFITLFGLSFVFQGLRMLLGTRFRESEVQKRKALRRAAGE